VTTGVELVCAWCAREGEEKPPSNS
jgi:hypothetical protein